MSKFFALTGSGFFLEGDLARVDDDLWCDSEWWDDDLWLDEWCLVSLVPEDLSLELRGGLPESECDLWGRFEVE